MNDVLAAKHATYGVCVFRAATPKENIVYPIPLRARLPVIAIPLRPADQDVPLDLQPLINQCHERGCYHRLDYEALLDPPLSAEDSAWVNEYLREASVLPTP